MTLLTLVVVFSLVLSAANWLLFVGLTIDEQRALARAAAQRPATDQSHLTEARVRPEKLVEATGGLASAFGLAGPSASAAAMSLACLIIAAVSAGVGKL